MPNIAIPEDRDSIFDKKREVVLKMLKQKFSFGDDEVIITRLSKNCIIEVHGSGFFKEGFQSVKARCYFTAYNNGWESIIRNCKSISNDLAGKPQVFIEIETFGIPCKEAQVRTEQLSQICDVEWRAWASFILRATPDDKGIVQQLLKELQKLEKIPGLEVKFSPLSGFIPKRE